MRGGLGRDFEVRVRVRVRGSGLGARGSGLGVRASGFGLRASGFELRASSFELRASSFEAGDSRSKPNAGWPKSAIRFFGFRVSDFEREIDAPARARAPSGSPRGRLQASRGASS
ncbi:hypothetical protein BOC53_09705 [Burkholderia pseudomallei]|nr:hypothetical protein BOC53_09705 [Burkholderia pseudomallei]